MVRHCVNGDREGVRKGSIEERERVEAVQEKTTRTRKTEARCGSLDESHEVLWASAHVHVCIHCVSMCVFVYYDRRISPLSLL